MNAKRPLLAILMGVSIVLVVSGNAAAQYAQPVGESIKPQAIQIPFPFVVGMKLGMKTLPAGTYDLSQPSRELLVLRSPKGLVVEVPVMTRLAKPEAPLTESRVVFDKYGDEYYISEVWIPGVDGFLVGAARDVHTHETVKVMMKK
jgi:hypothetical protein